jgi:hypothetical protein
MNNPRRIGRLLYKGSRNDLSESEERELTVWRNESSENEQLFRDKMDPEKVRSSMIGLYEERDLVFEKMKERIPGLADTKLSNQDFSDFKEEGKYVRMYPFHLSRRAFFGAAFVLGFIIFLLLKITGIIPKTAITHKDAVLPSSEGLEIFIDDGSTGLGAGLAGIDLKENKLGENDYYANSKNRDRRLRYSLPSGDQRHFRLILPDGTWIWVHPNTRIKYPVKFSQDSIHVTVLGKAYFEVNRDSLRNMLSQAR